MTRVLGCSHLLDEEPLTEMRKQVLEKKSSILDALHWCCQLDNQVAIGEMSLARFSGEGWLER